MCSRYYRSHGALAFFRNLVFAPFTEELAFRGILCVVLAAGYSDSQPPIQSHYRVLPASTIAALAPLWFGAAHLHHLREKLASGQALLPALLATFVQFSYTSIFGCMAALLFMRTGSLWAAVLSHSACNFVGLPALGFLTPASSQYSCLYRHRWLLLGLHAFGLLLFTWALFPLTSRLARQSLFYSPLLLTIAPSPDHRPCCS